MKVVEQPAELRAEVAAHAGRLAFVPTMGNLHQGHLELVHEARKRAARVAVSIFVNPMQFGANEDLAAYPRTLSADLEKLEFVGADLVFTPPAELIYPGDMSKHTKVEVPGISDLLCGASRPGHFVGVATVVCKLFNLVQPDVALFGKKDYQQLMVIRRMVQDLAMPVEIVGVDTIREADGLAMSSRNGYLTPEQRETAPVLYATLKQVAAAIQEGATDFRGLEHQAAQQLNSSGLRTDYVAIREQQDLGQPRLGSPLVILAAAWLGKARLIDNLEVGC